MKKTAGLFGIVLELVIIIALVFVTITLVFGLIQTGDWWGLIIVLAVLLLIAITMNT